MRTATVSLRPVASHDYPLLVAWQNDPEIARWMDYRTPFTLRDIEEDQERARREGLAFVIEHDGRPVGKCGLNQFRRQTGLCSMYIYVGDRTVWSRGVGRAAVMSVLTAAFDDQDMSRVELTVLADNERARHVYEACGFVPRGVLRGRSYRATGWQQTTVMSVDRADFERVRSEGLPGRQDSGKYRD